MSPIRDFEEFDPERLVKSSERVRDLAEVFTPARTVDEMLDLLPDEIWQVHPSATFLEPSVGNGNFVSAILSRKLTLVDLALSAGSLPAGRNQAAAEFHALEALSSIYGVDISEDNIIGGTKGHEIACRPRLLEIMQRWRSTVLVDNLSDDSQFLRSAKWIVDHNFIIANMLERDGDGKHTGRDGLTFVEYKWDPFDLSVTMFTTTLGDLVLEAEGGSDDLLSLFDPTPPTLLWSGPFGEMSAAEVHAQIELYGKSISNSRGKG
jgi:hypothetical protein